MNENKTRLAPLAPLAIGAALCSLVLACALQGPLGVEQHRWWAGLGPVLPHDSFPAECSLCHVGESWQSLTDDFTFDHEAETGVRLDGAHSSAGCLRCHNDRGPVQTFQRRGCVGCHEDIHLGQLGANCKECHDEHTWQPSMQYARHFHTRFPLTGVHATTSCRRCHPGAEVGKFVPTDTECVTCHRDDLATTTNHVGLGWIDRCDRCHIPTLWQQAEVD